MSKITAADIARQIARNLHDDYEGFTVDSTDTGAKHGVPPGQVYVDGYIGNDDVTLSFVVTVSDIYIVDYSDV